MKFSEEMQKAKVKEDESIYNRKIFLSHESGQLLCNLLCNIHWIHTRTTPVNDVASLHGMYIDTTNLLALRLEP